MSTVQRTLPPAPAAGRPPGAEPELIRAEREALRELLRLVAERAEAEAEVESTRSTADAGGRRANTNAARRRWPREFETLKANCAAGRRGRAADDRRRRGRAGEAAAKSEFSRASRRIATEFDAVREQAKADYARGKSAAVAAFEAAERSAVGEVRRGAAADRRGAAGRRSRARQRLAVVFESYKKFGLHDPPLTPTREPIARTTRSPRSTTGSPRPTRR